MSSLDSIESLLDLQVSSFEEQIAMIDYLGNHMYRARLIENLRRMAKHANTLLESTEEAIVQVIEKRIEDDLGEHSKSIKFIAKLSKENPNDECLKSLSDHCFRSYPEVTAHFSKVEAGVEEEIGKRFKVMKLRIANVMMKVERL